MRRREFTALIGYAATILPVAIGAQGDERPRRIGVLMPFNSQDAEGHTRLDAFLRSLEKLGWSQGRNVQIDVRWAIGSAADQIQAAVINLVQQNPDVIFVSNVPHLAAIKHATSVVPIVFAQVIDPIGHRFVTSLARPGGNITGFTNFESAMTGKWLELIKMIAPGIQRVLILYDSNTTAYAMFIRPAEESAAGLQVKAISADVHTSSDIEAAVNKFEPGPDAGMFAMPSSVTAAFRQLIVDLAASHHLPTVYPYRYFVTVGGLISYGIDPVESYRQAASYIDRIFNGEKPANLPVQEPTKFQLVINLKVAKVLGFTIPPALLAIADEVIE